MSTVSDGVGVGVVVESTRVESVVVPLARPVESGLDETEGAADRDGEESD